MDDINCKEVNWEEWETEGSAIFLGSILINMASERIMAQWIREATGFKENDSPAMLDSVFTTKEDVIESQKYLCPLGKTDHLVIEFAVLEEVIS